MVTESTMREALRKAGARCRHTTDRELWFHRRWQLGLPLGMAFIEIEKELKRIREREAQIRAIKAYGFRCPKGHITWTHPNHVGGYTRREAFGIVCKVTRESFNDIANGRD